MNFLRKKGNSLSLLQNTIPMKKLIYFLLIMSFCISCSDTEDPVIEKKGLQQIYEDISLLPNHSIFSDPTATRGSMTICGVTFEDLEFLGSLSREELANEKRKRQDLLGSGRIAEIESNKARNLAKNFDILGGHDGVDKIKIFAKAYMNCNGGWRDIEGLLPDDLSIEQTKVYVGIAVYIDRIARPIYLYMTKGLAKSRLSEDYCLMMLQDWFTGAGLNIDAAEFVARMGDRDADGDDMGYDLEDAAGSDVAFDAIDFWNEYNMCLRV